MPKSTPQSIGNRVQTTTKDAFAGFPRNTTIKGQTSLVPSSGNRDISKYPTSARNSITSGLKTGNVRFEPNSSGGEYIYSGDKSFGAKPVNGVGQIGDKPMTPKMSQQAAMTSALNKAGAGKGIGFIDKKYR